MLLEFYMLCFQYTSLKIADPMPYLILNIIILNINFEYVVLQEE